MFSALFSRKVIKTTTRTTTYRGPSRFANAAASGVRIIFQDGKRHTIASDGTLVPVDAVHDDVATSATTGEQPVDEGNRPEQPTAAQAEKAFEELVSEITDILTEASDLSSEEETGDDKSSISEEIEVMLVDLLTGDKSTVAPDAEIEPVPSTPAPYGAFAGSRVVCDVDGRDVEVRADDEHFIFDEQKIRCIGSIAYRAALPTDNVLTEAMLPRFPGFELWSSITPKNSRDALATVSGAPALSHAVEGKAPPRKYILRNMKAAMDDLLRIHDKPDCRFNLAEYEFELRRTNRTLSIIVHGPHPSVQMLVRSSGKKIDSLGKVDLSVAIARLYLLTIHAAGEPIHHLNENLIGALMHVLLNAKEVAQHEFSN
jgi:hypothetical protein